MSEPTYMNGKINYELMIKSYAEENEMSLREAMEFIASRNSLECAASLIGVEMEGYRSASAKAKLDQLGEFLDRKGYQVPRLWEVGTEQYIGREKEPQPQSNISDERVVQYLKLRKQGMPRYKAAEAVGVKQGSVAWWLRKCGLDNPENESAAMDRLDQQPLNEIATSIESSESNVSSAQGYPQAVDKPLRKEVTVTLTLEEHVIRAGFEALIQDAHETAVAHGWYDSDVPLPVQLALIHSEVSEALEADRKHKGEDAVAEELADVIIRVMDTSAAHKLDLAGALFRKMAKNRLREYRHGNRKY